MVCVALGSSIRGELAAGRDGDQAESGGFELGCVSRLVTKTQAPAGPRLKRTAVVAPAANGKNSPRF